MNSKDRAVSEVVAAILLISLVIIGISIVSVMLTSGPPPEDIPKVSVQMIPKDEDTSGANASFYHGGGDSLRFYATTFTDENGNPINTDNIYLIPRDVSTGLYDEPGYKWKDHPDLEWNYSSIVRITEEKPGYQIHHNVSTGNYLLKEFGKGHSGTIEIPTITPVPTVGPIPDFCNDPPSAAFTAGTEGDYRNILNCSIAPAKTNNLTHKWTISGKNFRPVSFSGNNWSFTYTLPIPYDTNSQGYFIQHTVYNSTPLCSDSSIQYVTVPPCSDAPCVAGFSYLVDGKTVQFTADGPDKGFFSWEYGDGQNKTIINNTKVEHTYLDNKSIHSVTLTKKINRCDQDFTCSVTQKVTTESIVCGCFRDNYDASTRNPWNVEFTWNPLSVCSGLNNKDWKVKIDYGDGTSETFYKEKYAEGLTKWLGSTNHSYAECRDYSVKMDVIDLHGGIYYTCTKTINLPCICTTNPNPAFTATAITPSNLTTIITDTSTPSDIIQWTYDFGDGTTPINFNTTTKPDPFIFTHTYSSCGSYVIKLIVHDAMGCWAETTRTISCGGGNCEPDDIRAEFSATAAPNNPKRFNFIDSSYSNNNTLTRWEWDFGDGTSAINTSPPGTFWIEYDKCGSFPVKLRVWDDIGCWDDVIKEVSCNCPKPIAQFTVESMSNPREFRFTSTSTHDPSVTITDWEWDFGDGVTSTGSSVTHRYTNPGTYTVRLRVTTNCDSWDHTFQDITAGCPSPNASFDISTTDNPTEFRFTDRSTLPVNDPNVTITQWFWEFGDGTNSTDQNPTHNFPTCSQYTVRLTVTTNCGTSDDVIRDIVCGCPEPVPDFDYNCIGEKTVNFTDLSRGMGNGIKAWYWEFGDLRPDNTSGLQNPIHEYDNPGTYPVNLTIFTTCNSSARWTRQVTVPCCQMPVPDFTYTCHEDGNTIRFNDTTKIFGDTIARWNWNFGDGVGASSDKDPLYRYSMPGTYPVNLTITTECGAQNSWIHDVTVPCLCSPPIANFTKEMISSKPFTMRFTDHSMPNSDSVTSWNWSFGDGTNYSGQNPPDKTYTTCGEYLVNLRVTNDCGQFDDMDQLICCPVFANFTYRQDPPDGDAPVTVYFTDLSEGMPNAWSWDFGDGHTSYLQNPVHIFTDGGNFTVTLHATSPCGGNETHSKVLTFGCPDVTADFSYIILSEEPFQVSFNDLSFGGEIVDWTWFFGDGTTSKEQHPVHLYGGRANYNVGLIVKNNCGNTAQIWRRIAFECPNLTADFNRTPVSGMNPLEVKFEDNSTPLDKIMSWLWFFGDGTSYYTTSPSSRHPPNHTYTKIGTYYVTLQIKNECGNPFSTVKTVNVTSPASISGYVWNDKNMSKIREPNEVGLANWEVTLQERVAGGWVDRDNVLTNATGYYSFNMDGVTYGAFRVRETLQPRWNATYSYPFGDESPESGTLLISSTRHYNDVNFGNVRTNTSTFEFPLRFYYGEVGTGYGGTIYNMNERDKYWDYNTSFNWERQKLFYPPPYLISYTAQGDSSFDVTIGFYARYLIFLSSGNRPPISRSYWLRYWLYPPNAGGTRTNGFTFFVPDNTDIYRPDLFFERDDVRWFELYIPFEGSTIPYSTNSYVEAHMTGTGGSTTGCTLTAPVTMSLTWTTTHGYFTGNWDNTPYEGQWITITARNDFGTGGSPRYITSSKNVFVDWQPVSPLITSPTNNTIVQGTANIIATVGGHNRDTDNVRLYVDDNDVGQLVYDSGSNTFANTLSVEQYAGKTIKVVARAYPMPGRGEFVDSTPVYLRVRSIDPIQANFVAEPWNGPAPLEVVFTDTSTGGPSAWLWNFGDGFSSTEREPVHIFQTPGNYSVSLQVTNIVGATSVISRYVNTTGVLNTVNLLTNRNGYLHPGYASWRVRGEGSTITVNGTEYLLVNGDRVRLDIGTPQTNVNIRVVGEINSFNVTDVTLSVNGNPIDTGTCSDIRIRDFDNYHSDLRITTYRQTNAWINLIWNAFPVTIQNYQNLDISELLPSADKIMEIIFEPGNIFFDGRASSYRLYS